MEDKNLLNQTEQTEVKGKGKAFWKGFGIFALSLVLAVFTVIIISIQ